MPGELSDTQLNDVIRRVASGFFDIGSEARETALADTMRIIQESPSDRNRIAAVKNLLNMAKSNRELITTLRGDGQDPTAKITHQMRREALNNDDELARLRQEALAEDESKALQGDNPGDVSPPHYVPPGGALEDGGPPGVD